MKKTVITVIRVIVIVAILGLLTYGGFVGMNRVSGTGDYTSTSTPRPTTAVC